MSVWMEGNKGGDGVVSVGVEEELFFFNLFFLSDTFVAVVDVDFVFLFVFDFKFFGFIGADIVEVGVEVEVESHV